MQNVQNAAEIQQRVINLVELYRTKKMPRQIVNIGIKNRSS